MQGALVQTDDGGTASRPISFTQYPQRWVVIACFCCASALNAVVWLSFAAALVDVKLYYGTSSAAVNSLAAVFMFAFAPAAAAASFVLGSHGLRAGVLIGAALTAAGCLVRLGGMHPGEGSLPWLFVGQTLAAVGQPFLINSPAMIANVWFGEHERTIATAIAGATTSPC